MYTIKKNREKKFKTPKILLHRKSKR